VAGARSEPFWAGQEALAHTLAYDATIMGDYWLPKERFARVATRRWCWTVARARLGRT
jgi:hypothetical protein